MIIDKILKKREYHPIQVGLFGCGFMGSSFIRQVSITIGVEILAICNRDMDKAAAVFKEHNPSKPLCIITNNPDFLINLGNIDIIIDMTGSLEYSANFIIKAFENKIPVLTMNAELLATVGCVLNKYAKKYGVLFSDSLGDQPGVEMDLYRYIGHLGLKPIILGNMKGFLNTHAVKKDITAFIGKNKPTKVVAFTDGTKVALEQALVANATGLKIYQRGMIGLKGEKRPLSDIFNNFPLDTIKDGISDYIIECDRPFGVFCIAKNETLEKSLKDDLEYLHCGKGPYYCFHTPLHLCFFDTIASIVRMVELKDEVIRPLDRPIANVITVAKRDLNIGEMLDGIGGEMCYGLCENFEVIKTDNLIPMGLIENCILKNKVKKDDVLTFSDVDLPPERLIDQLWKEQLG